MAFSDLCHISNAFKNVENEADQSDRIMEENSMVRDLITKILDEPGPENFSSTQTPDTTLGRSQPDLNPYAKNDTSSFLSPTFNSFQNSPYLSQNENSFYPQNDFTNGFANYTDNYVNLLGIEPVSDDTVTPEQLNLLRLAAQEIGGAQFTSPAKYDEKFYNFFEPNQRNSLPEANIFNNYNQRPNSLNLDMNYSNYDFNTQRYPNNSFKETTDPTDLLTYLHQLNLSLDRTRDENIIQNNYKMPEINGHYQNEEFKLQDDRNKVLFNRNFQHPPAKFHGESNFYGNEMMNQMDRSGMPNFDFNQPVNMNFKPNGNINHQNDFMRRDVSQVIPREGFQNTDQRPNFDNNINRDQQALARQQELARQMNVLMRNRPPPNQLNVDVSFLHESAPFNLGLNTLLGPSPPVPPPVLPSPMLDIPLLAPYYAMRNMRAPVSSSSILHARLDSCYEQWRQLERERKRTEARLALAYPGRAVSSSNSIPVPRLPPCPTRVDRLTVDMLREHTKVLTLMGKMETLRASVCAAQNKKPNRPEDGKITVLKRGHAAEQEKQDPDNFNLSSWREDVKNLAEIAPHGEVESAMLAWRSAVAAVQAARRRELAPHRYPPADPILQLAQAVKQLCLCARRARCAMWCDLTLTVALAPDPTRQNSPVSNQQSPSHASDSPGNANNNTGRTNGDNKEEKPNSEPPKSDAEKPTNKQTDKDKHRRTQNYRHKVQRDMYPKNPRYDNRFVRHPYHYLATGPIN